MVAWRGDESREDVQLSFLCVSWVRSSKHETQLLIPGCSPCLWCQPTDCPNQGIPSTLPNTVSSSSAHTDTHPVLAPLHIVLRLL